MMIYNFIATRCTQRKLFKENKGSGEHEQSMANAMDEDALVTLVGLTLVCLGIDFYVSQW